MIKKRNRNLFNGICSMADNRISDMVGDLYDIDTGEIISINTVGISEDAIQALKNKLKIRKKEAAQQLEKNDTLQIQATDETEQINKRTRPFKAFDDLESA